jgi:hypothetical protein
MMRREQRNAAEGQPSPAVTLLECRGPRGGHFVTRDRFEIANNVQLHIVFVRISFDFSRGCALNWGGGALEGVFLDY